MKIDMVPQVYQLWQADTSQQATTTDAAGASGDVPDDFSSIFDALAQGDAPQEKKTDVPTKEAGAVAGDDKGGAGGAGGGADGKAAAGADGDGAAADGDHAAGDDGEGDEGLPDPAKVAADAAKAETEVVQPDPKDDSKAEKKDERTLEQIMRSLLSERETADAKAAQQQTEQQRQEQARQEQERRQQQMTPTYSKEEQGLLDAYQREYPEVSVAEELKRREEYKIFAASMFEFIDRKYAARLAALETYAGSAQTESHASKLTTLIPDYAEVYQLVLDWIGTQPPALKAAFEQTAKTGTAEDVKTMVDFWRTATGKPPVQQQQQQRQQQQRQQPNDTRPASGKGATASKAVLDALRPPAGKRTGVTHDGLVDPDNYDAGFKAFADMDM